jgi:hypothetical protein
MSAPEEAKVLVKKAIEDLTQLMELILKIPIKQDGTYTIQPPVLAFRCMQIANTLSDTVFILNQYRQK